MIKRMLTENELKELASQLSFPKGEMGVAVADNMNLTNINMTLSTIEALGLCNDEKALELGHGNGGHLGSLFNLAREVHYTGLEISELMHEEAKARNHLFIESGKASFRLYDGSVLPFSDNSFDKIFTVNTLYFWKQPAAFLNELHRILVPGGTLCIGFAWKTFMETLPFTAYGFELYDEARINALVSLSLFELHDVINHRETIRSKIGEEVEREYAVLRLKK